MHILPILCVFLVFNLVEAVENEEPVFHRFEYEFKVLEKLVDNGKSINLLNTQLQGLQQNIEELKAQTISLRQMKKKVMEFETDIDISTTYIRWGRSSCPDGATIVYDGFAAGSTSKHSGAAANYICLHRNPKWDDNAKTPAYYSVLYGAEYETGSSIWNHLSEHDVPCAVCRIPKSSILMVPGRNDCNQNYTLEYSGFLMSGYYTHEAATEFVCVDKDAEAAPCSNPKNLDGKLFFFVQAKCGSLKCPPYEQGKEITCAMCSYSPRK